MRSAAFLATFYLSGLLACHGGRRQQAACDYAEKVEAKAGSSRRRPAGSGG
jgi:hypothetical protein